ncbi:hypothetical protein Tco_1420877 [Tanacetum coccineum]
MTTLAEHISVAGAENHPLMLEKSMYDSWASRIRLFIKGKKNGRIMLDSIDYGLLLINDMHTIGMTMQQVQVNTKFLNALPSKWSKFFTDVKLAKTPIHHQQHHTPVNPLHQSVSPQPFISPSVIQQPQAKFPQLDSGFVVPTFQQGEDPINCINKAMAFLSAVASRPRNAAWFKEKLMLTEAQEAAFQTEDLDAYDSDCDDLSSAKAVLMANISSCDSDVLSEVPYSDTYPNDMINQDVQEMTYSEQTYLDDFPDTEINSDSYIIPYS